MTTLAVLLTAIALVAGVGALGGPLAARSLARVYDGRVLPRSLHDIFDRHAERYEEKLYSGHGDYVSRRGWVLGRRTVWYDRDWS